MKCILIVIDFKNKNTTIKFFSINLSASMIQYLKQLYFEMIWCRTGKLILKECIRNFGLPQRYWFYYISPGFSAYGHIYHYCLLFFERICLYGHNRLLFEWRHQFEQCSVCNWNDRRYLQHVSGEAVGWDDRM